MRPLVQEFSTQHTPETLVSRLHGRPGVVLLRSLLFDSPQTRYSFVAAEPFLILRSFGSRCELRTRESPTVQYGNPWHVLESFMARYELLDEIDLPFPLGGCFGFWGYDLKNFVEPKLSRQAVNDLELPDCHVGFYDSLIVFDHRLGKSWIVSTGLRLDGSRDAKTAERALRSWGEILSSGGEASSILPPPVQTELQGGPSSNVSREQFIRMIERAQAYIRSGDIYQVNLSHRLCASASCTAWDFYRRLSAVSPAPFSAYIDCEDFQLISSSPEQFLRMSGSYIQTRPIKGTRPRSNDSMRDAQLTYELQTSPKELAELLMITDLLRNDLGRVCEYGSVQTPELMRLEKYPQVQHLVSTVEGRLRPDVTHFAALASCFPGGSITGAPKFRAMDIIDELEPVTRGPYTGTLGYLGFNRESQLSIVIRTAIQQKDKLFFNVGAGIVADSIAEAEYDETWAKAGGFMAALHLQTRPEYTNSKP